MTNLSQAVLSKGILIIVEYRNTVWNFLHKGMAKHMRSPKLLYELVINKLCLDLVYFSLYSSYNDLFISYALLNRLQEAQNTSILE